MGIALSACRGDPVNVTRIIEEVTPSPIEVTRLVTPAIETPVNVNFSTPKSSLTVCLPAEPSSLYPLELNPQNRASLQPILHAIYEPNYTERGFEYQHIGLEKLPTPANGGVTFSQVTVKAGDKSVDDFGRLTIHNGAPISQTQTAINFRLKARIWSDGTPVTAADSQFGYQLRAEPNSPGDKSLVDLTADYQVAGDLATRWVGVPGYKPRHYAPHFFPPLPKHLWGEFEAEALRRLPLSARNPVGDGAFVVTYWQSGVSILLERNPHYYRQNEGLPAVDQILFRFVDGAEQALGQLFSGNCDVAAHDYWGLEQMPALLEAEAAGRISLHTQSGTVYEHIDFGIEPALPTQNLRPDWFEMASVRQAIAQCIDRERIAQSALFGRGELAHSFVPATHPLYPETLVVWDYDPVKGNATLEEAGLLDTDQDGVREYWGAIPWWRGAPFQIILSLDERNPLHPQIGEMAQEDLFECGILLSPTPLPAGEYYGGGGDVGVLFGRQFDLAVFGWKAEMEPACQLYQSDQIPGEVSDGYCGWRGCVNASGFRSEQYDQACQAAQTAEPHSAAYRQNHQLAQQIYAEQLPAIPLFWRLKIAVASPNVRGFRLDPTQPSEFWNIAEWQIIE